MGEGSPPCKGAFDNSAPGGLWPLFFPAEAQGQPRFGFRESAGRQSQAGTRDWLCSRAGLRCQAHPSANLVASHSCLQCDGRPSGYTTNRRVQNSCATGVGLVRRRSPGRAPRQAPGGRRQRRVASGLCRDPRSPVLAPLPKPGHRRAMRWRIWGLGWALHMQRSDFPEQLHQAWPFSWDYAVPACC